MSKLHQIFGKNRNIIIGALHLPPLLGYSRFPGLETTLKNALADLKAFEKGGVNGVIFENNYDNPHKIFVDSSVSATMTLIGQKIKESTKLPLGINVLWDDFYASLSLAKLLSLYFVRIPVFVDRVETDCGIISGQAQEVIRFRKKIRGEKIALFTDIHVKHSRLLSKLNMVESAKLAVKKGSDAVIMTGNWTGQVPEINNLKKVRKAIGNFPIFVGSGTNEQNLRSILKIANGVIVSTFLKTGGKKSDEVNVKSYGQRISETKVRLIVKKAKN